MKLGVLIVFCLILNGYIAAMHTKSKSRLQFYESRFDFGEVVRGQLLKRKFYFKVLGQEPLRITGVHSSCGCAIISRDEKEIYQPQEEGFIEVQLDTTNFSGHVSKQITVMTNSARKPMVSLMLKAFVQDEFTVEPPVLDWGPILADELVQGSVVIRALKEGLRVLGVRYEGQNLETQLINRNSQQWELTIKKQKKLPVGFMKEVLYLKTNSKFLQEIPVIVSAQVESGLLIEPRYLEFGALEPQQSVERRIKLLTDAAQITVQGSHVELNINGQPYKKADDLIAVKPMQGAKSREVAIQLKHLSEKKGNIHGFIILKLDHSIQKEVRLDFYGFFR